MNEIEHNKQIIQNFIDRVWHTQNLAVLTDFWSEDCINHAMPGMDNKGIDLLRSYHEPFFGAFSNINVEILQQIAEGDRVVTYMAAKFDHSGVFFGIPATGKHISNLAIRIDRIRDGKIAEHWSISDAASLMQQLQS
jgi:predicted ester cyclase